MMQFKGNKRRDPDFSYMLIKKKSIFPLFNTRREKYLKFHKKDNLEKINIFSLFPVCNHLMSLQVYEVDRLLAEGSTSFG